jgi:hypothetical protein
VVTARPPWIVIIINIFNIFSIPKLLSIHITFLQKQYVAL